MDEISTKKNPKWLQLLREPENSIKRINFQQIQQYQPTYFSFF